jgi:hypothetical protein
MSFGGIDIAVGRMLNDARQAEEMVNKVFEYDLKSYGSWRNNFANFRRF